MRTGHFTNTAAERVCSQGQDATRCAAQTTRLPVWTRWFPAQTPVSFADKLAVWGVCMCVPLHRQTRGPCQTRQCLPSLPTKHTPPHAHSPAHSPCAGLPLGPVTVGHCWIQTKCSWTAKRRELISCCSLQAALSDAPPPPNEEANCSSHQRASQRCRHCNCDHRGAWPCATAAAVVGAVVPASLQLSNAVLWWSHL